MRAWESSDFPQGPDQPPLEFWEHTLELPAGRILAGAEDPGFILGWVKQRRLRQVAMLRRLLGLPVDAAPRGRRSELSERRADLIKYLPAAAFALRKSMHATLDAAAGCLDEADIRIAQESDGRYDTAALVFAILDRSWPDLEKVFHLDRLHKVGFARMRLPNPPRRPPQQLKDFLAGEELAALLRRYDAEMRDGHTSELKQVIGLEGAQIVFIRRPHHESCILAESKVVHGFTPDQIVLDFRNEAARLNIASHGHACSREIADRIAAAFYGQPCAYEDITEDAFAAQISRFLRMLRDDAARDLRLVELKVQTSPLTGAPELQLSNRANLSIGPALGELERALAWAIDDLDRVPSFKVLFNAKRVGMQLEPVGSGSGEDRRYVLRYRDETLSVGERQDFEDLIERDHGIKVVSTEKRGARRRMA